MPDFLEERISGLVRMGASYGDDYAVDIVQTAGGQEYRSLIHPFPVRRFDVSYLLDTEKTYNELQALYHRAHGRYAGFRVRCVDEYSTNGRVGAPTATDDAALYVSTGVYQLRKYYGKSGTAGAAGYPYRLIKKPVAGTVKVSCGGFEYPSNQITTDTTTGRVTIANKTASISGINRDTAVVTFTAPHTFLVNDSVVFQGIVGMGTLNSVRARVSAVTSTTITIALTISYMAYYVSGGAGHTRPQSGEVVSGGCEFDFPVRFNTSLPIGQDFPGHRVVDGVELIELLNP